MAYTMVRIHMPRRIVEIGSGHSTRFLARAIADGGLATRLTAIDPAPRAALAGLAVDWFQGQVQEVPPKLMGGLAPGDVLFVDSSHVLMPGSDVDIIFNRVMPMLPAGALVHLHDIFLPDGYPPAWSWRGYNEQSAVATLLTGGGYRLQWSSRYVATRMASEVRATGLGTLALPPGAHEASLWLEKL
jgi:predicted O-methyltransferase YrrM